MTGCNDLVFSIPDQAREWEKTGADVQHSFRGLFRCTRVHHGDAAVMGCEGESISTGRKGDSVDPTGRVVQKLAAYRVEWEAFTPCARLWAGINSLDVGREDSCM